jgi:alkylation response protein AidB-like acyl-CoA dehydrogenase
MHDFAPVETPTGESMDQLCGLLKEWSGKWGHVTDWPSDSLRLCGQAGVYRWFLPESQGGFGWTEADQTRGYLRLAEVDLTTTFVITQYMGAIRRIAGSGNDVAIDRWLSRLVNAEAFSTVGISHLTTSRQHLSRPALLARETQSGFVLQGLSPWVTGAPHADVYVIGATTDDGREILTTVPAAAEGIRAGEGCELVALSASCTDRVDFDEVQIDRSMVLDGPMENVLQSGIGARPGGLQTSTLALGLARAAVNYLAEESIRRDDLRAATSELTRELDQAVAVLLRASGGDADCDASDIRATANRLALRTTQAAMTAAKGAGFVEGHPVGRWCREALFFLVWSCPQGVAQAHLCELAFGTP